jgi:arylsulfatase A-like enzyme
VIWLMILGGVLGGYAGLLESIFLITTRDTTITRPDIVSIAVFYALIWGALGLAAGIAAWLVAVIGQRSAGSPTDRAFWGSLLFSLLVLAMVGGYVNLLYLPTIFSPISLIFDACLLLVCALLCFVLFRLWARHHRERRGASRLRSPLVFASLGLFLVLVVLAILPRREDAASSGRAAGPPEDINILLILVDALRPDHLGCYGYPRDVSPTVDRLAAEGVLFHNAYAQGSRTKETTASLVTSLYPATHNMCSLVDAIPKSSVTLMEAMQQGGFRTGIFSANTLVSPLFGFGRGVDRFYCEQLSARRKTVIVHLSNRVSDRIKSLRWTRRVLRRLDMLLPMRTVRQPYAGGDATALNTAFLDWLDEEPQRNFFALLFYVEPHEPYRPPPPFDDKFDPDFEGAKISRVPPDAYAAMLPFVSASSLPDRERENMIAQYDGSIAFFDQELGRLLEELSARGLADRTLVILTADHGEEFYEHGGWGHGHSLYEELIKLPLIIWCPDRLHGGRELDVTFRQIDMMPTLLAASGLAARLETLDVEGVDLWPTIMGGAQQTSEPPVFAEVVHGGHFARALKIGDHKVIHTRFGNRESVMVFDLNADPAESHDLATERPALADSLRAELDRMYEMAAARGKKSQRKILDEATRKRLESLGYIQ